MAPATLPSLATKALYVGIFVVMLTVQIPIWLWRERNPEKRPRKTWDLKRSLFVHVFKKTMTDLALDLGIGIGGNGRDPRVEVPEHTLKEAKFVFVDGFPKKMVKGQMKEYVERAQVEPTRIGGYWFGRRGPRGEPIPPPGEGEKIVMHCHGGGYVLGTAHPEDVSAAISRGILDYCGPIITRTFSIDYRLASAPPYPTESPFPTALLDALAGYKYLLDFGFRAENIILMGDSAGGNLALAMTRYLVEEPIESIPPPGALLVLSPWADITASHEATHPDSSAMKNTFSDYIMSPNVELGQWTLKAFLGPMGVEEARQNRYISPSSLHLKPEEVVGMFNGFPRTYIVSGGAERILDEIRTLYSRMAADLNKDAEETDESSTTGAAYPWVTYNEVDDAIHDFLMFPWHQPEVNHTFRRIDHWISTL